jgi:hypothetical protein
LEIVLSELDRFFDFTAYIVAKEEAITRFDTLMYCGEEDLLCHYFHQFDEKRNRHYIGPKDKKTNGVVVEEGIWWSFIESDTYKRRREANEVSYLWDRLLQITCQNALDQVLGGNSNLFAGQSAIYEMAMEPRFSRRALSEGMTNAINNFPDQDGIYRNLSYMPSFYEGKAFVFLQLRVPDIEDYDEVYRPRRRAMLEIACGVTKNKFPHLNKVVGIAIDAPKFHARNSEDFILLNCEEWSEEERNEYAELNIPFRFFETASLTKRIHRASDFPTKNNNGQKVKVGRNEKCPCGSGKKYKHCCK